MALQFVTSERGTMLLYNGFTIKKKKQFKRRQFGSVPITIKIAAQEGYIQCKKKWFVVHPTCIFLMLQKFKPKEP
jgi:hypothetical protein